MHLGGIVSCLAEDIHDFSSRILAPLIPSQDTHEDFIPLSRSLQLIFRDKDILTKLLIRCDEEGVSSGDL